MRGAAAISDKGLVRATNQDGCCVLVAHTPVGTVSMAVVCDGVGGLASGELASSYVVLSFVEWFEHQLPLAMSEPSFDVCQLDTVWEDIIQDAHERLHAYGLREGVQMGTTLTCLLVHGQKYLAAQVGDSRLYIAHDGELAQVTEDQTMAAHLVATGEIETRDVLGHPSSHVIMQAVGAGSAVRPCYTLGVCDDQDVFVLCSDGVSGALDDESMQGCLARSSDVRSHGDAQDVCALLVNKALEAGGHDNVSVVCLLADPLKRQKHDTLVAGVGGSW